MIDAISELKELTKKYHELGRKYNLPVHDALYTWGFDDKELLFLAEAAPLMQRLLEITQFAELEPRVVIDIMRQVPTDDEEG